MRPLVTLAAFAVLLGCSSTDEAADWPESIETTSAWPRWGFPAGAVTTPHWIAPRTFACEDTVKMKREPEREYAPGEGPRSIEVEALGSTCKPVGTTIAVVDAPSNPYDRLVEGSCKDGFALSIGSAKLADVRFATEEACRQMEDLRERSAAGSAASRLRTTARLTAPAPAPAFEIVSFEEAKDADLAVTEE